MAMTQVLLCPICVFALSCFPDTQSNTHEYELFYGTVRDLNTGNTLLKFCHGLGVVRSDVVAFSAPAGAIVEEEVLFEGRQEKYHGGVPPVRDEAFGCSDVPQVYSRRIDYWSCLRNAEADPPATILSVERRGELGVKETSSGYALKLEVRHPGVLNVVFDLPCLLEQSDNAYSDALVPGTRRELTIQ